MCIIIFHIYSLICFRYRFHLALGLMKFDWTSDDTQFTIHSLKFQVVWGIQFQQHIFYLSLDFYNWHICIMVLKRLNNFLFILFTICKNKNRQFREKLNNYTPDVACTIALNFNILIDLTVLMNVSILWRFPYSNNRLCFQKS